MTHSNLHRDGNVRVLRWRLGVGAGVPIGVGRIPRSLAISFSAAAATGFHISTGRSDVIEELFAPFSSSKLSLTQSAGRAPFRRRWKICFPAKGELQKWDALFSPAVRRRNFK